MEKLDVVLDSTHTVHTCGMDHFQIILESMHKWITEISTLTPFNIDKRFRVVAKWKAVYLIQHHILMVCMLQLT